MHTSTLLKREAKAGTEDGVHDFRGESDAQNVADAENMHCCWECAHCPKLIVSPRKPAQIQCDECSVKHTLSSSLTALVSVLTCLSPALSVAAPVSLAAVAASLEAGMASGDDMGGGKRMPAGRAPTLPLMTVRFTVPWVRMLPTRRPGHSGHTVGGQLAHGRRIRT